MLSLTLALVLSSLALAEPHHHLIRIDLRG
jgi:hypothetical protein